MANAITKRSILRFITHDIQLTPKHKTCIHNKIDKSSKVRDETRFATANLDVSAAAIFPLPGKF